MGVGSTLKSPVWMMTPSGVVMASATQLTMECVTWMNSIENGPSSSLSPGLTVLQLGVVEHFVLFQAPLHQRQREGGAVDRHVRSARAGRERRRCGPRGRGSGSGRGRARRSAPDRRSRA